MKIQSFSHGVLLVIVSLFATQSTLHADIIYGDFMSDTVNFTSVREINEDGVALYGAPDIAGDTLTFGADGFISNSVSNNNIDVLDGRLSFSLQAKPGFIIDSIDFQEFGSFTVVGDQSISSVRADGFATVGGTITGGSLLVEEFGVSAPVSNSGQYIEGFTIDFSDTTGVVRFDVDNRLNTAAFNSGGNTNSSAFIDKKGVVITVNTIPAVPEPSSAVVSLLAFGLISVRRRRKA